MTIPTGLGAQNQLPSTLPSNIEAWTLVNPNIHIVSEEIKAKLEADKLRLAKIARMQLKQKLRSIDLIKHKEAEEESVPQKTKKGKDKAAKEPLNNSGAKKSRAKSNHVL